MGMWAPSGTAVGATAVFKFSAWAVSVNARGQTCAVKSICLPGARADAPPVTTQTNRLNARKAASPALSFLGFCAIRPLLAAAVCPLCDHDTADLVQNQATAAGRSL